MSALGRGPVEKYGLRLVSNKAISGCPVVAGNGFLVTLYELLTVGFSHRLFYRIRKWCQGERYVCMGCMDVVANVAKFGLGHAQRETLKSSLLNATSSGKKITSNNNSTCKTTKGTMPRYR
ncbi:MAG: hypothetical protein KatS3mg029_0711 [Saprospiraceae bacterium]|nr:MAG: hypothetical protein KatS3mg029_0711 [Saprospiraceae bacterium]